MTKRLLIIGHIPSKNTKSLRDAVVEGAQHPDLDALTIDIRTPFEAQAEDVLNCDGVILGTTENLGYMSGALKDFFDRCYYALLEEKQGLPYGAYIRAGLDGTGTIRGIESIVTNGLRWKPICPPVLCKGDWDDKFIEDTRELGLLMAAGLDSGVF
ncbi:MAG: flavodoxin family protein [Alphaproteobacteria bacterium]|nr:flavodoxin family protein [Alphaproteobacteria bacterium]